MFAVCNQAFAVQLTLFPTSVSLTCQLFILKEGIDWLDRIPRILFQIFQIKMFLMLCCFSSGYHSSISLHSFRVVYLIRQKGPEKSGEYADHPESVSEIFRNKNKTERHKTSSNFVVLLHNNLRLITCNCT